MSSKISANRRLEELTGDNEFDITAHTDVKGENCVAWFFANKQLKMEIKIEALEACGACDNNVRGIDPTRRRYRFAKSEGAQSAAVDARLKQGLSLDIEPQ